MTLLRSSLWLICWLGLLLVPAGTRAEELREYRHVANWKELRDKNVVKQRFDYSCGSGALSHVDAAGL